MAGRTRQNFWILTRQNYRTPQLMVSANLALEDHAVRAHRHAANRRAQCTTARGPMDDVRTLSDVRDELRAARLEHAEGKHQQSDERARRVESLISRAKNPEECAAVAHRLASYFKDVGNTLSAETFARRAVAEQRAVPAVPNPLLGNHLMFLSMLLLDGWRAAIRSPCLRQRSIEILRGEPRRGAQRGSLPCASG